MVLVQLCIIPCVHRDDGFTKKVIGFISKKADLLFQNSADSEVTQSITRDDEEKSESYIGPKSWLTVTILTMK